VRKEPRLSPVFQIRVRWTEKTFSDVDNTGEETGEIEQTIS
jgi:hypothetical protein